MRTREVLLRPGRCGWAVSSPGSPLPEGLPERESLFIVAVESAGVRARDSHGRIWQLARDQVHCGLYFSTPKGGWIHESSPQALKSLRAELQQHLNSIRPDGPGGTAWDRSVSRLLWILERNGDREVRKEA